jgi:hypothetical protein
VILLPEKWSVTDSKPLARLAPVTAASCMDYRDLERVPPETVSRYLSAHFASISCRTVAIELAV